MRIFSKQLDIKLGQFTQEQLDSVLNKELKRGEHQGLMKYHLQSMEDQGICSDTVMPYIIKTQ